MLLRQNVYKNNYKLTATIHSHKVGASFRTCLTPLGELKQHPAIESKPLCQDSTAVKSSALQISDWNNFTRRFLLPSLDNSLFCEVDAYGRHHTPTTRTKNTSTHPGHSRPDGTTMPVDATVVPRRGQTCMTVPTHPPTSQSNSQKGVWLQHTKYK